MSKHIDLGQHLSIRSAPTVSKLANPLIQNFDIKYFRYLRLYQDKSRILLSNFPDCIRFIYEEDNYKKMWFEGEFPDYLGSGFNVWRGAEPEDKTEFEKEINHNLGLYNGITYVNQCQNYWELFTFDAVTQCVHTIDRKLLIHYMLYFKEQAQSLISAGEKEKLILPHFTKPITHDQSNTEQIAKFLSKTSIERYYLSGDYRDVYLTHKEACCIYWIIQGKTAEEIAMIEGNSKKTIERHLENIRLKLKCYKQAQVLKIVIASGILESLFLNQQNSGFQSDDKIQFIY